MTVHKAEHAIQVHDFCHNTYELVAYLEYYTNDGKDMNIKQIIENIENALSAIMIITCEKDRTKEFRWKSGKYISAALDAILPRYATTVSGYKITQSTIRLGRAGIYCR